MRLQWPVCAVVLALSAGCSTAGPSEESPGSPETAAATQAPQSAQVADPAKVLAQATFDGPRGKFELGVVSLTARGRLADLTLTMTPHYPGFAEKSVLAVGYFTGVYPEVTLVDPVNLKRYLVVKDSAGAMLGAGNEAYNIDRPNTLSYTFAAPPGDVGTLDVYFASFPPFRGVPVTR
ncbi:hypothetical protein [Actinocorallia herbida]|nr:hypothetical protein [Actinocorallia herbida]